MKKILPLLIILVLIRATTIYAQSNDRYYYEHKARKFTKWKYTGIALGSVGIGLLGGGIGLMASAEWTQSYNYYGSSNSNFTTDDPKGVGGLLMLVAGIPFTALGIVFTTIGTKKSKYYRRRAAEFDADLGYSFIDNSVTFRYRF